MLPRSLAFRQLAGVDVRRSRRSARHVVTVIAFHVSGEVDVEQGSRVTFRAGDLHIIPAGHEHRILRANDAKMWGVAIQTERLDRARFAEVLMPLENIAHGTASPRIAVPEHRQSFVASLFHELSDVRSRSPIRHENLLGLLLSEAADHAPQVIASAPSKGVDSAARVIAFIASHALSPLSLEDVARGVGRNRSHVAEVVRSATGRTVGSLIAEVRLDEARRRLEETDELVEVIGERVGYPDATHFARMFKRRFGAPPRAWRSGVRAALA